MSGNIALFAGVGGTVASAALNGTSDFQFNPSGAFPANGTYTLVTSRNGTLGGAWEFAGEENMTAAANSIIVKSNSSSGNQYSSSDYYRLTLGGTAGSETVTVSTDVPSKVIIISPSARRSRPDKARSPSTTAAATGRNSTSTLQTTVASSRTLSAAAQT